MVSPPRILMTQVCERVLLSAMSSGNAPFFEAERQMIQYC